MKKSIKVGLLGAALMSVLTSTVTAASSAPNAIFTYATTAPKIDGVIDAVWSNANKYEMKKVMIDSDKGFKAAPASKDDLSATWRAMWDEDNIYFLAEVTDDIKVSKKSEGDGVEIYLDMDNVRTKDWTADDSIISMPYKGEQLVGGTGEVWWGTGKKLNTKGAQAVTVDTPTGYIVEISYPWADALGKDIKANKLIGFDAHVSDNDGGTLRAHKLTFFSKTDDTWQNPSLMATVKLAGSEQKETPSEPIATASPVTQTQNKDVGVKINGKLVQINPKPVIINSSTFIPLRGVFETLGAKVTWDKETHSATVVRDTTTVKVTIGSKTVYVNGEAISLESAPFVSESGSTYVPLRFISETIGAKVSWDNDNRIAVIDVAQ